MSPAVNSTERFAWMRVPAKSVKPAPTISTPVHRSERRNEATSPADTNETPATIVNAASVGLSARSWPLSIAAAPSTAQAAVTAPILTTTGCERSSLPAVESIAVTGGTSGEADCRLASLRSM